MTLALERVPNESKRGAKAEVPPLGFGGYKTRTVWRGSPTLQSWGQNHSCSATRRIGYFALAF